MTRRIAIAGWFGSDNLGDELILASLVTALRARGAEPVAITIDAARTGRDHGIETVTHRNPSQSPALRRALRDVDGMAIAGGVIQSETSPWNIPFHTSRLRAVGSRFPVAAVGMGVGQVHGLLGRGLSRRSLRRLRRIVVRDADSAQRLRSWGLDDVAVGADPVMALEPEPVEPDDTMCVILRPANRRGPQTAASKAETAKPPPAVLDRLARAIDAAAASTGLAPRFVALQASRDGPLHTELAGRLTTPAEVVTPTLQTVVTEVGRSRLVVTMRYHGAVAALLHGRPAVLLDSSPKMASLAGEGGGWAPLLDVGQFEAGALAVAASHALAAHSRAPDARIALTKRLAANHSALDSLVEDAW